MFTEDLWKEWSAQEERNYKLNHKGKRKYEKKGYTHFDYKFWFPTHKEELKHILENGLKVLKKPVNRIEYWSFAPFLKMLVKTPRYRYQEPDAQGEDGYYDLETKVRPICFASHMDSLIFGFYSYCLTKKYEEYIKANAVDECVLAYRSDLGICNIQFAKEVFDKVKERGNCTAIALDIKGYFDHIEHGLLKEKWTKVLGARLPEDQFRIYKALTQYSYISKDSILKKFKPIKKRGEKQPQRLLDLIPANKDYEKFQMLRDRRLIVTNNKSNGKAKRMIGIPQGSALSALLSNIYLIDFDKMMYEKSKAEGFIYRRYCDDILIICDTEKTQELKNFAISKIAEDYYLTIQDKKVETIDFHPNSKDKIRAFKRTPSNPTEPALTTAANEKRFYKSLQYLGFEFNGQDVFIRSSSLSRYFRKMKARNVKSVAMTYGANRHKSDKVFTKQILERYSHFGSRNFLTYAYKAASERYRNKKGELKEGMNSTAIRKQVSRHFTILVNDLKKTNEQRYQHKVRKFLATWRKPPEKKSVVLS